MVSQVRASHILVNTETEANDLLARLKAGADFGALAMQFSTCPSGKQGGDLNYFGRGQMVKEFEEAAFNAQKGQVVGPVRTAFGFHLIKVTDRK